MTTATKVMVGIAAVGWGLLALLWGEAIVGLYQSGYGHPSAIMGAAIPFFACIVSVAGPYGLARVGSRWAAFLLA